ncbi:MAG: hypothetical protein M1829_002105 [Trizodia sp. TS-e1964]|nr:MAG: hypothetical protein M1829_002105 [Trizodia sp. TS-e1964]
MDSAETSEEVSHTLDLLKNLPAERVHEYSELLSKILTSSEPSQLTTDLNAFLDSILGDSIGIITSRTLLGSFVSSLRSINNAAVVQAAGTHALELLSTRVASFGEQDADIRMMLATSYEAEDENAAAARVLQGIQTDSSQRSISDDIRVQLWIRITRNLLEVDNTVDAEVYLNKAKSLLYKCEDPELKIHFQLSQARILDARRKFLDASSGYHSLSFSTVVAEEERLQALSSAIICAVLAPAGPQRSRALGKLYGDERARQLEEFGMLEKIFFERLLSSPEVEKFEERLAPHQLSKMADGSTVLEKAVIEHNLLGASRLYSNINVDDLGNLLGLPSHKAEEYAARMIEQGRMLGRIDQIARVIIFESGEGSGAKTKAGQADRVVGKEIKGWDENVQVLTEGLEKVTTYLQQRFPGFVEAAFPV